MEKKEEKKKKIMKKQIKWPLLIITGILFIFLTMNVYALGISPGRTTFNFEPGIEKEVNFSIVNTDNKAMNVSLRIEGEWSEFIALNQTDVKFNADEYSKILTYRVKFPSSINKEGIKAKIVASEFIFDSAGEGTNIGINIAVEHQLYIETNITLPETEINISRVFVEHYEKGKAAKVEVEIRNPSTKTMKDVHSTMMVFDKKGLLRSQFNSTSIDIGPSESETIEAYWDTYGFEEGDYGADLIVYYDNKTEEQNLLIYLRSDRIEIDFGKFEFEKKISEEYIIEHEEIKINIEMLALIIFITMFVVLDIVILIRLKKLSKKHKK